MNQGDDNSLLFFEIGISIVLAGVFIFAAGTAEGLITKIQNWTVRAGDEAGENIIQSSSFNKSFGSVFASHAYSKDNNTGTFLAAQTEYVKLPRMNGGEIFDENSITAISAIAVDENTDTVLFQKKMDKRWPIASITKLLTASLILDLNKEGSNSNNIIKIADGDLIDGKNFVQVGESIDWNSGLQAMLIGSSNTLAVALTKQIILGDENWQELINSKIVSMDLQKTQIREPSGISPGNISTANEVARIFKYAIKYPEINKALGSPMYNLSVTNTQGRQEIRKVESTNWFLLGNIDTEFKTAPITKTGYIPESGYNIVGRFEFDGHSIIVVVLGSSNHYSRFIEFEKIAEWVFANYTWGAENSMFGG